MAANLIRSELSNKGDTCTWNKTWQINLLIQTAQDKA